jgi:hypothetical protein
MPLTSVCGSQNEVLKYQISDYQLFTNREKSIEFATDHQSK